MIKFLAVLHCKGNDYRALEGIMKALSENFKFQGKKYELLVVIDDYSRFIIKLHVFDHFPNIPEITEIIKPLVDELHPKNILTDNNPFADAWAYWCFQEDVNAVFAHPYYPQDKGKVERAIRNISEELVYLFMNFGKWFDTKYIESWRHWFNEKRYHRGLKIIRAIYLLSYEPDLTLY
jgi:transposase InsO family protein